SERVSSRGWEVPPRALSSLRFGPRERTTQNTARKRESDEKSKKRRRSGRYCELHGLSPSGSSHSLAAFALLRQKGSPCPMGRSRWGVEEGGAGGRLE